MNDDDAVKVHIVNAEDLHTVKTEEREPEHFVFSTVVVAYGVTGYNNFEQVLALDPLRKDASIMARANSWVSTVVSLTLNSSLNSDI